MIPSALALAAVLAFQAGANPAPPTGAAPSGSAPTGSAPQASLGARNIFTEFKLPPLQNRPGDAVWLAARRLQVIERARLLGLHPRSATEAWSAAEATYHAAQQRLQLPAPAAPVTFNGTRASELNALLAQPGVTAVVVTSPDLQVDAPIRFAASGTSLDLGQARLRSANPDPYLIRIENLHDIRLSGGSLEAGNWGVLVAGSQAVTVTYMDIHDLAGGGILLTNAGDAVVWGNRLHGLHAAPVLLNGVTKNATVANNEIFQNLGSSNWHAGVVISDRNVDYSTTYAEYSGNPHFFEPMAQRLLIPHDNLIAENRITENSSSGVYSDGSDRNVIVNNQIERNSKEGLCLDNGSVSNVVAWNLLRANGKRWGKSDLELKQDFVLNLGRLSDGSSPAKLPGISIDNAAYNQVVFNDVDKNFGGGIKIVRTGFYNLIGVNLVTDNDQGRSKLFHFFGLEMGAAPLDGPSIELDSTPSRGNEIFANTIRGTHYSGIFFADGSDRNNIFDNAIFGATDWAMESVKVQPEYVLNNLTNLKLRNIGSGLDPGLLKLGAGIDDTPPPPPAPAHPSQPHPSITPGRS